MAKKGSQFTTYHPDFKLQVEDYLNGKRGVSATFAHA